MLASSMGIVKGKPVGKGAGLTLDEKRISCPSAQVIVSIFVG